VPVDRCLRCARSLGSETPRTPRFGSNEWQDRRPAGAHRTHTWFPHPLNRPKCAQLRPSVSSTIEWGRGAKSSQKPAATFVMKAPAYRSPGWGFLVCGGVGSKPSHNRSTQAQLPPGRRFSRSAAYFSLVVTMKVHNKITVERAWKAKRNRVRLCIRCGRAQKPRSKAPNCYGCGENMVHSADSILKMLSSETREAA
jgi:hypothetical protein